MGRDIWGQRHTARKPKHQNYSPRPMLSIYTPTIRWYMTWPNSDTVQKTSPCPDFHNLHVSMNQSHSTWPRIIRPLRTSQNTHVPILRELTSEITSTPRPQSVNLRMTLSCNIMFGYQTLTSGVILLINEHGYNQLSYSSIKYIYCYHQWDRKLLAQIST